MNVAIYARVSTDEQTTENQLAPLREWAKGRGWRIVAEYQEAESAWRGGRQAELAKLLTDARWTSGKTRIEAVVVWALDRLSREGPMAILQLVHRLKQENVRVLSYQEPWTEAPGQLGDLLYSMTGWVAQQFSQRRSEQTKAGIERRRRAGLVIGRPPGSKNKKKVRSPAGSTA